MTPAVRRAVLAAWLLIPAAVPAQPLAAPDPDPDSWKNWFEPLDAKPGTPRVQQHVPPVAPANQPSIGMNSPQYQQALALINKAAEIEMYAARYPNNWPAQKTAAAASANLKARAALIMQADNAQHQALENEMMRQELEDRRVERSMRCRLPDGRRVECQ